MQKIDLRPENPPLGYRAEDVPILDLSNFDRERDRFPNPNDSGPVGVFHLRDHPDFVLRHRPLDYEDANNSSQLRELIAAGTQHLCVLDGLGLYIPPHRHIEALIPAVEADEGEVLTIAQRLPASYQNLNPGSREHLPGCMTVLDILYNYLRRRVTDESPNVDVLIDIYEARQFSIDLSAGRLALHDTDGEIRFVREPGGDYYYRVRQEVGYFTQFAEEVSGTASGTQFETPLAQLRERIGSELPEPLFDPPPTPMPWA